MNKVAAVDPRTCPAWSKVEALSTTIGGGTIRELIESDPTRPQQYTLEAAGIFGDFSRQRVNAQVVEALRALAAEVGVLELRDEMFSGAHINTSEDRAVLHTALRLPRDA